VEASRPLALIRKRGHMQAILERLRAEFLEMPGLRLTADQVHRLCGVERKTCRAVLDALVDEKFLCAKADGTYARLTEGDAWHHRPAS
jgi:response regulator of citrate/malate metabolism